MSFVIQRSAGGCHIRSLGGVKNMPLSESLYAGLLGYWPITGMGTFNSLATPDNCAPDATTGINNGCMDDIWPNVYKTLTLTWSDGGGTATVVYQYQDYCDQLITVSESGACWGPFGWDDSPTITPTTVTQYYDSAGPDGSYRGGFFTATLSNKWTASSDWAAKVSAALALIAGVAVPTPTGSSITTCYYPTTTGNQWTTLDAAYMCAALLGFPTRDISPSNIASYAYQAAAPALDAIFDVDSPSLSKQGVPTPNQGAVVVLASQWVLAGLAPGAYVDPGMTPLSDHKTVYAQPFDLGSFAMGAVAAPSAIYASGTSHANPLLRVPQTFTFLPSDVLLNLPGGSTYGILGFRPAAL